MKSTKQLLSHMETHDDGSPNPFPCSLCGKSYKNLYSLNFHLKAHGGIRDFKCELCDKAFTNASHLRRHMNSHTGKKHLLIVNEYKKIPNKACSITLLTLNKYIF